MQNKRTVKYFLDNEKYTDCSFIMGDQTEIRSHKLILAVASNVFEAMLFGNWGQNGETESIEVTDVQPEAFKAMLRYIYTGDIKEVVTENVSCEQVCAIYYAAEKYQLSSELCDACLSFLEKSITPTNVCTVYEFSKLMDLSSLRAKCNNVIKSRTHEVLNSPGWREIELSTLFDILNEEKLKIKSEVDLFNAIIGYFTPLQCGEQKIENNGKETKTETGEGDAITTRNDSVDVKVQQQQQSKLLLSLSDEVTKNFKNALKKIRFLTMTLKEFVDGPYCLEILSHEEVSAIIAAISRGSSAMLAYPVGFSRSTISLYNACLTPNIWFQ